MLCHIIKMLQCAATVARRRASAATSLRRSKLRVLVVTAGSEGPALDPESMRHMGCAAVWGLARTAQIELGTGVLLTCMDTDALANNDLKQTVCQILEELVTRKAEHDVAYRAGVRHVRRLKRYLPQTSRDLSPLDWRLSRGTESALWHKWHGVHARVWFSYRTKVKFCFAV